MTPTIEPTTKMEFLAILEDLISKIKNNEVEINTILDTGLAPCKVQFLTPLKIGDEKKEALYQITFRYKKGET